LTSENPQKIEAGGSLEFTFSVRWTPSSIPFARRFERYLDYTFFEHQVPHPPLTLELDHSLRVCRPGLRVGEGSRGCLGPQIPNPHSGISDFEDCFKGKFSKRGVSHKSDLVSGQFFKVLG